MYQENNHKTISSSSGNWDHIPEQEQTEFLETSETRRFWQRIKNVVSPREYEILELLARGYTQYDIAELLKLSRSTVQTAIQRATKKLEDDKFGSMSSGHTIGGRDL